MDGVAIGHRKELFWHRFRRTQLIRMIAAEKSIAIFVDDNYIMGMPEQGIASGPQTITPSDISICVRLCRAQ